MRFRPLRRSLRRGRWSLPIETSPPNRACSFAAIPAGRASRCRGSSCSSWPAAERQPFQQRQRPAWNWPRSIVDPDNPLTRRVIVNRVWMHHFGEPLVLTPSDFGIRSEPPIASGTARLAGHAPARQTAGRSKSLHRADRAARRPIASQRRPARVPGGRSRKSPAVADEPPPAGIRSRCATRCSPFPAGSIERCDGRAVELTKPPFTPPPRRLWLHRPAGSAQPVPRVRHRQPRFEHAPPPAHDRPAAGPVPDELARSSSSRPRPSPTQPAAGAKPVDDGQRIAALYRLVLQPHRRRPKNCHRPRSSSLPHSATERQPKLSALGAIRPIAAADE